MQPTIEILDRIRKNSRGNKEEIFTRLYRYLLRPDLYSVKNGIILLMLAFLISPMGLPLLAVQGLGKLQDMNTAMKNFIHS